MKNINILLMIFILLCIDKSKIVENFSNLNIIPKNDIQLPFKQDYSNKEIKINLNKYPKLNNIIEYSDIEIPNQNNFIPQGIAVIKDIIYITGYYENNTNSKCYLIDKKGNIINTVTLDTNSHVGSIAYDKINDLIWIPDNNGILNAYNPNDFISSTKVKSQYQFNNISEYLEHYKNDNEYLIAYLYVYDKYLYIGNFSINKTCTIKKYEIIKDNNKVTLKYINKFKVPKKTQSILFMKENNKTYMILSNSYGRRKPSYINVYKYNDEIKNYNGLEILKIKAPPMLEQINIYNKSLYFLFESNATKYWNCPEKVEYILVGNSYKLLNR